MAAWYDLSTVFVRTISNWDLELDNSVSNSENAYFFYVITFALKSFMRLSVKLDSDENMMSWKQLEIMKQSWVKDAFEDRPGPQGFLIQVLRSRSR